MADPGGWNLFGAPSTYDIWRADGGADLLARQMGVETSVVESWLETLGPEGQQALFSGMPATAGDVQGLTGWLANGDRGVQVSQFAKTANEKQQNEAERAGITRQLQEFVTGLQRPIQNPDGSYADSIAQQLARSGATSAGSAARNQGLGGGISVAAAQQGTQAALLPYLQQRKQMEMQGLGMVNNRDISLGQLRQGATSLQLQAAQQQNQAAMSQWADQRDKDQAFGTIVGGGLGFIGSGGNPAVAKATGQIGGSITGSMSGPPPTYRGPFSGGIY